MADSLQPWISGYLIDIAETYGAKLSDAPSYKKKKKVQITEFLTYGSDAQDTAIWARVSDKQYIIPMKFTKDAVAEYSKSSSMRLTQHKGAIMSIQSFRPIVSRFPLDNQRMSANPCLALECIWLSILGSSGEGTFGNPKSVTTHPDISLWFEGLVHDGGAANVLKERRQIQSNVAINCTKLLPVMPTPPSPHPPLNANVLVHLPLKRAKVTDIASYNARWQIVERNLNYRGPPEENKIVAETSAKENQMMPTQGQRSKSPASAPASEGGTPNRSRSGTPVTNWEESPKKEAPSPDQDDPSSSIPAPTPAQRMKPAGIIPVSPEFTSSYPPGNETVLGSEPQSSMVQTRRSVPRKVPRPASPEPPEHTGPARVLVPNSDTSGTQSQTQSQPYPEMVKDYVMDVEDEGARKRSDKTQDGDVKMEAPQLGEELRPWLDLWQIRAILARTAVLR